MKRYIVNSEAFLGYILLGYDGWLVQLEINGELTEQQIEAFYKLLPMHQKGVSVFRKQIAQNGTASVEEYKEGLTFDYFWDCYNYKAGNKKRSERCWNKLNNINRNRAVFYLGRYEQELKSKPHQQKMYADTYLTQQRWNN